MKPLSTKLSSLINCCRIEANKLNYFPPTFISTNVTTFIVQLPITRTI